MAAKRQYQREMDAIIARCGETGQAPRLLLHACCAPCSSWCMEYLSQFFRLTVFFYNPNITEPGEYRKRAEELRRLIREQPHRYPVDYLEGAFEPGRFFAAARGLENCPEGGDRCRECFRLRLGAAAGEAARGHVDPLTGEHEAYGYFTTTLTISPLKDAVLLNTVGEAAVAVCRIRRGGVAALRF